VFLTLARRNRADGQVGFVVAGIVQWREQSGKGRRESSPDRDVGGGVSLHVGAVRGERDRAILSPRDDLP
jgi:hypothetical protein